MRASTWSVIGGDGAAGGMPGYGAAMGGGADPRVSPYGAMATMPGMPGFAPAAMTPGLPPGWESTMDPSTGKPYYFNRATGESAWTPPAAAPAPMPMPVMAPMPAAAAPALPPGWESTLDPSSGKTYYFNRATNETRWTLQVGRLTISIA